jgi:hypothetical protein
VEEKQRHKSRSARCDAAASRRHRPSVLDCGMRRKVRSVRPLGSGLEYWDKEGTRRKLKEFRDWNFGTEKEGTGRNGILRPPARFEGGFCLFFSFLEPSLSF